MKHSIVIVDDHPIVRKGFIQLINLEEDLEVIGEAEDSAGALDAMEKHKPDLVIIDLSLKNSSGLELIKDLARLYPKLPMLVVSLHDEKLYAERALRAGAKGFIMKMEATENLLTALRQVLSGGVYLSDGMKSRMLESMTSRGKDKVSPISVLSDRELEVFQMIGNGITTGEIASKLCLSVKTVETYKSNLKKKLRLHNSNELIQHAVEWTLHNETW
ncbi:MAG: response regulator transcription factor [Spirochaetales bacterium]|nr:response regulator transcription factor [Spirochaetales bacterium]